MENDIKRRKELEDNASPILLIGSRAQYHDFAISAKDWDLIIPHNSLITFIEHHFNQFSWLNIQRGVFPKITGRLINGQMLEFEIVENYESTQLLYTDKFIADEWRQYTTNNFGVGQIKLKIASKESLLALKYSTCFFPVNWTKNVRHMNNMKKSLGCESFEKLLADPSVRQLVDLRARETLARCLHYGRIIRKQIISADECRSATYIPRVFEVYSTTDEKNCIDFALTGIKIDKNKFLEATEAQKKLIVEEQLTLLEHFFRAYGPQRAAELALEAFITQSVPVHWFDQMNALLTKTHCVYTKSNAYRSPEMQTPAHDWAISDAPSIFDMEQYQNYLKIELGQYKAPKASDEELGQSTFANAAIVWAVDHVEEFLDRQVPSLENMNHVTAQVALPNDVWDVIADHIDDHITLANFERICKAASKSSDWRRLAHDCWTEEELERYLSEPSPNWKLAFSQIYAEHVGRKMYSCPHCGGYHFAMTKEEWDQFSSDRDYGAGTEAYGGNCYCSLCDAGSWGNCGYYPHMQADGTMFYSAELKSQAQQQPPQPSRCLVQ